jgi:hypothetical protein
MTAPAVSGIHVSPPVFFLAGIGGGFLLERLWPLPPGGEALRLTVGAAGHAALALWLVA